MQKLLFFLICLLSSPVVFAQFGVKGGLSYGATYGERQVIDEQTIEGAHPALGYQFGITGRLVRLTTKLTIGAELLFESRRSVREVDYTLPSLPDFGGYTRGDVRDRTDYLTLPVLLSLGGDRLSFYAGPSFSYLLAGRRTYDLTSEYITIAGPQLVIEDDVVDLVREEASDGPLMNRLSVALTAGVKLPLTSRLALDARVFHTVTDLTNDREDSGVLRQIGIGGDDIRRDDFDSTLGIQAGLLYGF